MGKVLGPSYVAGRPASAVGRVDFCNVNLSYGVYSHHADVRISGGSLKLLPVASETSARWDAEIVGKDKFPYSLAMRGTARGDSRYGGSVRQPKDGTRTICRNAADICAAVRARVFAVRLEFASRLRLSDGLSIDKAIDLLPDGGIWIELDCAQSDRDAARRIIRRRGRSHQAVVLDPT
jgi:hypothetical protein